MSPVVGIMLMLAVTILIASIVSTYAGGFTEVSEKPPQASIAVTADLSHQPFPRLSFTHTGGDPFSLDTVTVSLQSGTNKTSIKPSDASAGGICRNFSVIGPDGKSNETTVRVGDTFYVEGTNEVTGSGSPDTPNLTFGKVTFLQNRELTWMVIDTRSSKTIAMGSLYL